MNFEQLTAPDKVALGVFFARSQNIDLEGQSITIPRLYRIIKDDAALAVGNLLRHGLLRQRHPAEFLEFMDWEPDQDPRYTLTEKGLDFSMENAAQISEAMLHSDQRAEEDRFSAAVNKSKNRLSITGLDESLFIKNKDEIVALLGKALGEVSSLRLSNPQAAQAVSLISVAVTLAEAPDPPSDLVWAVLERASHIAGVAALLVAIFALMAST